MAGRDEDGTLPLWPSVEAFCADLARRVEDRSDALVDTIVDAIRRKVPAYTATQEGAALELHHGVAGTVGSFLRTLIEVRDLSEDEVGFFEAVGEERALHGFVLEDLRAAQRVASEVGYDHLHEEADALAASYPGRQIDLGLVSRHLSLRSLGFYALQWAAFEAGHARVERDRATAALSYLFEDLLAGGFATEAAAIEAAARAGVGMEAPCALLTLVAANGDARDLPERVRAFRSAFPDAVVGPVRADPCPHAVALLTLEVTPWREVLAAVARQVAASRLLVVAEPVPTLVSVAPVYRGLRRSLVVAPRLRPQVVPVVDLGHVWAASFFDRDERFLQVDAVLGECLSRRSDWAEQGIATLIALRNARGDAKAAALELGIEESSVYGRLNQIKKRCELDFENPRDLATLGWVVSLYSIDPGSLPEPGDEAWGQRAALRRACGGSE